MLLACFDLEGQAVGGGRISCLRRLVFEEGGPGAVEASLFLTSLRLVVISMANFQDAPEKSLKDFL